MPAQRVSVSRARLDEAVRAVTPEGHMATVKGESRFESDASRYAAYLDTPEGRLRADLSFANVQDFLPARPDVNSLRALDLGCGTAAASIRLARLGIHVTAVDSSAAMLDVAERGSAEAGVHDRIGLQQGDAVDLTNICTARSFDIVLCHNLLEYVDEPGVVLRGAASVLRGPSAILSVLVRNQAGEVLKAALRAGDLAAAEQSLDAEWGQESLYGGRVRLFTPEAVDALLKDASLTIAARRGVRTIADYLPERISRAAEYERTFALERRMGSREEFLGIARYMQYLARL